MGTVDDFLTANADTCGQLSAAGRETLVSICKTAGHLRPRTTTLFYKRVLANIELFDISSLRQVIYDGAIALSRINWSLVVPFFHTVPKLPEESDFIAAWFELALNIARADVDVGVAYMEQTPQAMAQFGREAVACWAGQALAAIDTAEKRSRLWPAAKSYLIISAQNRCAFSLARWGAFLEQADHIARRFPNAAKSFMEMGHRACLLLNEAETRKWIQAGLANCQTEEELLTFFSGTSQKALDHRDDIAAGEPLQKHQNTLALICEALIGRPVRLRSNRFLAGTAGFSGGPANDGQTVFLPEVVPSFRLYKLMALHQVMLIQSPSALKIAANPLANPNQPHLAADRELVQHLPGLKAEMARFASALPGDYPETALPSRSINLPWWGDILPHLVNETNDTLNALKQKARDEFQDLPPEVVEAVLAGMLSEGNRDQDLLWKLFAEMVDNLQFDSPEAEDLAENVKTFTYKEWDRQLSDYKMDWCLVRQRFAKDDPHDFIANLRKTRHGLINLTRRQFQRMKPERFRKYRAQPHGDALDLDALIQAVVDKRSGSHLSENVYIRRDKRIRDVAVLFLVDLSASTEEEVNGRRIIDIQKEAMGLMAEALDALNDPYAIYGFSSEGRFRVDMFSVKEFNEAYSETVQYRLGNLEPLGLTRMGTVIRHATHKLNQVPAAIKLMIILTDGRPYDLEYGTLDYAVADTQKAIREARRSRQHPFIITADKKSMSYLKRIAPQTQSIILPRVELLPTLLPTLYKRLTT